MRRIKSMPAIALAVMVSLGMPFNAGTVRADDAGGGTGRAAAVQGAADDSGHIAWENMAGQYTTQQQGLCPTR